MSPHHRAHRAQDHPLLEQWRPTPAWRTAVRGALLGLAVGTALWVTVTVAAHLAYRAVAG